MNLYKDAIRSLLALLARPTDYATCHSDASLRGQSRTLNGKESMDGR